MRLRLVRLAFRYEHARKLEIGRTVVCITIEDGAKQLIGDGGATLRKYRLSESHRIDRPIAIQRCGRTEMIDRFIGTARRKQLLAGLVLRKRTDGVSALVDPRERSVECKQQQDRHQHYREGQQELRRACGWWRADLLLNGISHHSTTGVPRTGVMRLVSTPYARSTSTSVTMPTISRALLRLTTGSVL